jgi:hypothetical protein
VAQASNVRATWLRLRSPWKTTCGFTGADGGGCRIFHLVGVFGRCTSTHRGFQRLKACCLVASSDSVGFGRMPAVRAAQHRHNDAVFRRESFLCVWSVVTRLSPVTNSLRLSAGGACPSTADSDIPCRLHGSPPRLPPLDCAAASLLRPPRFTAPARTDSPRAG